MLMTRLTLATRVRDGRSDSVAWKGPSGFAMSEVCQWWMAVDSIGMDYWKLIWNSLAPFRVQCFFWLACVGRVKTAEFLFGQGII